MERVGGGQVMMQEAAMATDKMEREVEFHSFAETKSVTGASEGREVH